MLKLSILEFILRTIPSGILYITSVYVFSYEKINLRRVLYSGGILAILIYFIRTLPIQFGVHTIIFLIALIFIAIWINKIDVNKAISSSLISVGIISICDWASFFIMTTIFKGNVKIIMSNPMLKILYGVPSFLLYVFTIYGMYKILHIKKK